MNFVLEFTFLQDYSAIVYKIIEEKEKMDVKKISSLHPLNRHSGYDQSTETSSNVTIRIINSDSSHNLNYLKKAPSIIIPQGPYKEIKFAAFLNPKDIALIDERISGFYRSKPAKDYFIHLKDNFAEIKGPEAVKYFQVREIKSCVNVPNVLCV
jgi:hypothetical protein